MQPQENFARKYYSEQVWTERTQLMDQGLAETRQKLQQEWKQLFAEIEAAIDLDPTSEAAQRLSKRWLRIVDRWYGSNDAYKASAVEAYKDRLNWPPAYQEYLLASFGLDPQDRAESMRRLDAVNNFIGRASHHKVSA